MDLSSFESLSLGQAASCSLTRGGLAEMQTLLPEGFAKGHRRGKRELRSLSAAKKLSLSHARN